MHPLEVIQNWFDELHSDAKERAANVLMDAIPKADLRYDPLGVDAERILQKWLSARGSSIDSALGRIISVRALMDFCLIRELDDPEYWAQRRIYLESAIRRDEERGLLETWLSQRWQRDLATLSAMEDEWKLAARRWQILCERELSNSEITKWYKAVQEAHRITKT